MNGQRRKRMGEMEGKTARWYAKVRGTQQQLDWYRAQAAQLTRGLPQGARVLEIAPGPGYFAVEIARFGRFEVTGLDVSHTFVEIARENAVRAGVKADFHQGDVAAIPFAADSFDLIVCQAAFKNFTAPAKALNEMHRVLRPGGMAVIQDLSRNASWADIGQEVRAMELSTLNALTTRLILGTVLRRRAYSPEQFRALVATTAFRECEILCNGIGLEVRLKKTRNPAGEVAENLLAAQRLQRQAESLPAW